MIVGRKISKFGKTPITTCFKMDAKTGLKLAGSNNTNKKIVMRTVLTLTNH